MKKCIDLIYGIGAIGRSWPSEIFKFLQVIIDAIKSAVNLDNLSRTFEIVLERLAKVGFAGHFLLRLECAVIVFSWIVKQMTG